MTTTVGLRELRQRASRLVEEVEAGGEVVVTVSGRPTARLVPYEGRRPATAEESNRVLQLFRDPALGDWMADIRGGLEVEDDRPLDPWERVAGA